MSRSVHRTVSRFGELQITLLVCLFKNQLSEVTRKVEYQSLDKTQDFRYSGKKVDIRVMIFLDTVVV